MHVIAADTDILSQQEIVSGFVAGTEPPATPRDAASSNPLQALRDVLRPFLERGTCVIGFSGGRDSSVLLAAAVVEARARGLPLPVAATLEFDSEATDERAWQEIVIRRLGLDDWVRLPQGDRLDMIGPIAIEGLRRHGPMYPANAHMVVPLAQLAAGGSVVTGVGGDDVFGNWRFHDLAALFARRRRPRPTDLRRIPLAFAPHQFRTEILARQLDWCQLPWLRQPMRHEAAARICGELASAPRTWEARAAWMERRRMWRVADRSAAVLGADHGAAVGAPLLDPGFLHALGRAGGRWGWGNRTAVMQALFAELLPVETIQRGTKAEFSEPYFGPHTKRFAQAWDGRAGIDPAVVDGAWLRAEWLDPHPSGLSCALLQSVWLSADALSTTAEADAV